MPVRKSAAAGLKVDREKPPKMIDAEQFESFRKAAQDVERDTDDEDFKGVLPKLAKPKATEAKKH